MNISPAPIKRPALFFTRPRTSSRTIVGGGCREGQESEIQRDRGTATDVAIGVILCLGYGCAPCSGNPTCAACWLSIDIEIMRGRLMVEPVKESELSANFSVRDSESAQAG